MTFDGTDWATAYDGGTTEIVAAAPGWREVDTQLRRLAARRCALDAAEAHWLRLARRAEIPADHGEDARLALRTLGFSASESNAAVGQASAHVDAAASLEDWIRAALRLCRRPGT